MALSFTPFLLGFYILLTWGICAAVLIGIGSLLLRPIVGNHAPLHAFWAGLFLAVALLQLGHCFVPISWHFSVLLGALGLLGLLMHGRTYFSKGPAPTPSSSALDQNGTSASSLLWSLLITAAIAIRCVAPCEHYDTGFYGAMAVRWLNTYPIVPGLANLMAELGFNSSVFLCVAGLNHGPWSGLAFHLFPGLLLTALTFSVVPGFCSVWSGRSRNPSDLFLSPLVIPGVFWVTNAEIVGTNTDLPTIFVALTAFHYLLVALETDKPVEASPDTVTASLFVALLLFPLAVALKISSALFALVGWSLALAQLWRLGLPPQRRRTMLLASVVLPTVLLGVWGLRGIVLSGYPFFPRGFLGFSTDWHVPLEWAHYFEQKVRSWARIPWASLSETEGWRWVGPWFRVVARNRLDFIFPAIFSLAGIITLLRRAELRSARWLHALVPSACALVFWFWQAPAIRFGEFAIWSTAGTLGAVALLAVVPGLGKNERRVLLLGLVAIGMWCSYPRTLWRVFYRPAFEQRTLPRLPQVPVAPFKLDSNLTVLVPFKTNQCWDAPIPCSPNFYDSLRLRRGSDLRSGFSNTGMVGEINKSRAFHRLFWTGPEPDPSH